MVANKALVNPFHARNDYPRGSVITYKVCSALSYLLVVITSIYYTFERPHEGRRSRHTIWDQNRHHHTAFALNSAIITIYWSVPPLLPYSSFPLTHLRIVLYTLQIPYLASFYPSANNPPENVKHACDLAPHFITHNLLTFGFIHLWCRSYFWEALLLLAINFIQLTFAYFRFPNKPRNMHIAVVAGPLAFSFVALFWDGAAAAHANHAVARVVANVFVWTWVVYGMFYLVVFKDWAMGFALAALAAGK